MSTTRGESTPVDDERTRAVTAHRSSPDRVVFVEQNNADAWIATDVVVEPTQ